MCCSAGSPKVGSEKRFAASVTVDEEILLVSPTRLLLPEECTRIFGYPRAELMSEKYELGKVVGAGSFGVVREAVKLSTGERVAVKTISKMMKRIPKHLRRQGDRGTISKHLNKLQLEVDAMKCLRGSLNAVSLYDLYEGDEEVREIMEAGKKKTYLSLCVCVCVANQNMTDNDIFSFSLFLFSLLFVLSFEGSLGDGAVRGRNDLRENHCPGLHRSFGCRCCAIHSANDFPVPQQRCDLHGRQARELFVFDERGEQRP